MRYHEASMEHPAHILPLSRLRPDRTAWGGEARARMRPWGITITDIAMHMGVSRQYVWQVLYDRTPVSDEKREEVSRVIDELVRRLRSGASFGRRLKGARIGAGMTLRQVAERIGYSWVAVERWEKDVCLPKPGVLWHLRHIYGVGEDWLPADARAMQHANG